MGAFNKKKAAEKNVIKNQDVTCKGWNGGTHPFLRTIDLLKMQGKVVVLVFCEWAAVQVQDLPYHASSLAR